jgi:hypothetical protein
MREAIAAKAVNYYWVDGKNNPTDNVSKHWTYPQIWHMLQPILFYSGDTGNLNKENTRSKFGKDLTSGSEDTAVANAAEKGGKREGLPQVVLNQRPKPKNGQKLAKTDHLIPFTPILSY